jgi:threonine aldolase
VLQELRHIQTPAAAAAADAAHDDSYAPTLVSGVDALLRCCLKGQQAPAGVVLAVARTLLQQRAQWAQQQGYRGGGSSSAAKAHAVLMLHNSQLAALAGEDNSCCSTENSL